MATDIRYGDLGLFDEFVQNLDVEVFETPLMRVGKVVRWKMFEPVVAAAVIREVEDKPQVRAHKDLDARWTKKNQETHYGYKDHVKVDVKDKLILKAVVPPASVPDSQPIEALLEEGDRILWADSAYRSEDIEAALAARGLRSEIHEKGTRGHPLTEDQKASNREKSRTRARVEHVFAQMSGSMKALYQRCIGMTRNAACLKLTNLVYNLPRFEQIQRLNLASVA